MNCFMSSVMLVVSVTLAGTAQASDRSMIVSDEEDTAPTAPEPLDPVDEHSPSPSDSDGQLPRGMWGAGTVCGPPVAFRATGLGSFFRMADVSAYGGGAAFAVGGGRCQTFDLFFEFQFVQATTPGGLDVHAFSGTVDLEVVRHGGLRAGLGGGYSVISVRRTTTGEWVDGNGAKGFLRLGYDTGLRLRPIVLLDLNATLSTTGGWGPSLEVGIRF